MSPFGAAAFPLVRSDFQGVDWSTDPQKLGLGALQECVGFRVTREGNLVTLPGITMSDYSVTGGLDRFIGGIWYPHGDLEDLGEIVGLGYDTGTPAALIVDDIPLDLGNDNLDAVGFGAPTSPERLVTAEVFHEDVYAMFAKLPNGLLKSLSGGGGVSAVTADLDDDGDANDNLEFLSIGKYGEHLMGHGFGDEQGSGTNQTTDLGVDRPEIVRWSNLGAADDDQWRPEDWIMVGTRGIPVMRGHEAFGSYACMKPEGVWLLYGDLENGLPQLESLIGESGESPGSVAPNASCVYNGVLYWLSPEGPMRWSGGARAEYLGLPTKDSMLTSKMSSVSWVLPAPNLDVVLFGLPATTDGPILAGGVPGPGATGTTDVWMWEPRRERWVGRFDAAILFQNGFVAPQSDGTRRIVFCGDEDEMGEFEGDLDTNMNVASAQWQTGDIELDEGRSAIYHGMVLAGEFEDTDPGHFRVRVEADGAVTRVSAASLFFRDAEPASAGNKGDVWYDTNNDQLYVSDGSSWVEQRGFEPGQVRLPHPAVRAARISVTVSGQSFTSLNQTIEWFGLQVTRG